MREENLVIMKRWKYVFFISIAIASLLAACSGSPQETTDNDSSANDDNDAEAFIVEIDAVVDALQNPDDWVVIDVRTPEEYSGESRLPNAFGSGRLKGSVNVARELLFDADGELIASEEIVRLFDFIGNKKAIVYCHGGVRSTIVWEVLVDLGFDVYNYTGSWIDWSGAATVANGSPNEVVLSLTEAWTDNEGVIE